MLIIHVRHFLNEQGRIYFDSWFKECYAYLSKQDGFHLIQRAYDNTNIETVHIWFHFENREKMMAWGASAEHRQLIAKLDPYRIQDWEATWYDTEKPCVEKYVIPHGMHNVLILET